jgi:hypothetical protein
MTEMIIQTKPSDILQSTGGEWDPPPKDGKILTAPPSGGGRATSLDGQRGSGDRVTAGIGGSPVPQRILLRGRKIGQDRLTSYLGDRKTP